MKVPKRPITEIETARANKRLVPTETLSPVALLSVLNKYNHTELNFAKECVKNKPESLTIKILDTVWNAISRTLDHHDCATELSDLEDLCAGIVVKAWHDEMKIIDINFLK